jgi:hypothetical protein
MAPCGSAPFPPAPSYVSVPALLSKLAPFPRHGRGCRYCCCERRFPLLRRPSNQGTPASTQAQQARPGPSRRSYARRPAKAVPLTPPLRPTLPHRPASRTHLPQVHALVLGVPWCVFQKGRMWVKGPVSDWGLNARACCTLVGSAACEQELAVGAARLVGSLCEVRTQLKNLRFIFLMATWGLSGSWFWGGWPDVCCSK